MAAATRASGPLARTDPATRARRLFLRFDIAGDRYVMAASRIVRMLRLMPLKNLPGAPAWAAGVLLYGETPVPVIDVAALAVGRQSARRASTRIALVDYRDAAASDGADGPARDTADALPRASADAPARLLGLLLEHATETVHYDEDRFVPCGLDNREARYLGPVLADEQGMVQWVYVNDLLPAPVRERLFQDAEREAAAP